MILFCNGANQLCGVFLAKQNYERFTSVFFSGVKGESGNAGPPGKDGLKGDTGEKGTFQTREKVHICF